MTATAIARKDFEDAVRSKMVWAVLAVFVFIMLVITVSAATNGAEDAEAIEIIPLVTDIGGQLMIPILALLVGYMAIVGERQSGSLRVFFGLSHGRRDVFLGKLASRLGVIVLATAVACVVALASVLALFAEVPARHFLAFAALTVLLGMVFTSIAVAVSASARSRLQAMGGAIGSFVVFTLVWHPAVAGLYYLVEGNLPGYEAPEWYFVLLQLNPLEAYTRAAGQLSDQFIWGLFGWHGTVEDVPEETLQEPDALMLSERVGGELPLYLQDWVAVPILLVWIVVPLAIGYWRFERADLN